MRLSSVLEAASILAVSVALLIVSQSTETSLLLKSDEPTTNLYEDGLEPGFEQAPVKENLKKTKAAVIFVPGDGGCQLEAKLNKTTRVHYICDLETDWFDIWLNLHLLAPLSIDCLVDNLKLRYDSKTRRTFNTEGVLVRARDFGSTNGMEYLDTLQLPKLDYFYSIIETLVKKNNYQRNINIFGAPYDFRRAPNELGDFLADFRDLIIKSYVKNGYQPVTLICHSMGCLNSVYLLNKQTQDWKDVFIKRLITLATPWSGSFTAVIALLFGETLGIPMLNAEKLRYVQSTFPSSVFLLPIDPTFDEHQVLVELPEEKYSLENFSDLLLRKNIDMTNSVNMWLDTRAILKSLKTPNVELWCLYSDGIPTPTKIKFEQGSLEGKYLTEFGDGDGTVNIESLRACENFARQQEKPVKTHIFSNLDHTEILRNIQVKNFISANIMSCDDAGNQNCALLQTN